MSSTLTAKLPAETTTAPAGDPVPQQQTPTPTGKQPAPLPRLVSLDAYRGFIMLAMASSGLGLAQVAKSFPDDPVWRFLGFHTDHVQWVGCAFWDLIQPSFMFMVGVAMPFSYVSRKAKGDSETTIFLHVLWRSLLLVLLGVMLSSNYRKPEAAQMTEWIFTNVLCQIGLGYTFLYLLRGRSIRVQLIALVGILAGTVVAFGLYPVTGERPPGVSVYDWGRYFQPQFDGWFAHWSKNTNLGHAFDVWFLNLFPHPPGDPYQFNPGGYVTLNFVPSLATMLLGLMAGEMLRRESSVGRQLLWLVAAGLLCLGVGALAAETVVPMVKRIWTPSWALYSTGWTFLILALFHAIIEWAGWKRWAFPLVVVGVNSIAMYCMYQLFKPWILRTLKIHLGGDLFAGTYGPIIADASVLLVLWLFCYWMYRRKLFLKI
jgi:predicted acyltransferase